MRHSAASCRPPEDCSGVSYVLTLVLEIGHIFRPNFVFMVMFLFVSVFLVFPDSKTHK